MRVYKFPVVQYPSKTCAVGLIRWLRFRSVVVLVSAGPARVRVWVKHRNAKCRSFAGYTLGPFIYHLLDTIRLLCGVFESVCDYTVVRCGW